MHEYHFPGIFWPDQDKLHHLAERMMVSTVQIVDEPEAAHKRFRNDWAILPNQPRPLTDDELAKVVAPEEAKDPLTFIKVSREIGSMALDAIRGPARPITNGIIGAFYARRFDLQGEPSVTKVPPTVGGDPENGLVMLGMHIDHWAESIDRSQKLAVINFGPGPRWHLIAPAYNFTTIGSYKEADVARYVRRDLASSTEAPKSCYWIRLDPPDEKGDLTVLVNSPVAMALHDGIVIGSEPSEFGAIRLNETDKSILAQRAYSYIQEL